MAAVAPAAVVATAAEAAATDPAPPAPLASSRARSSALRALVLVATTTAEAAATVDATAASPRAPRASPLLSRAAPTAATLPAAGKSVTNSQTLRSTLFPPRALAGAATPCFRVKRCGAGKEVGRSSGRFRLINNLSTPCLSLVFRHEGPRRGGAGKGNWGTPGEEGE
jgi:hypothetical protein